MQLKTNQSVLFSLQTSINRGRGGTYWIAVKPSSSNTDLDSAMKAKSYRPFRGAYTKQALPNNVNIIEQELIDIAKTFNANIDLKGVELAKQAFADFAQEKQPQEEITQEIQQEQGGQAQTSSEKIDDFANQLKKEMATSSADEHTKIISDLIEKQLDQLATSVDEAAKKDFIKDFFAFAAKFWNYSFANQILIFFQSGGKAHYVKGKKQWIGLGRKVKTGEEGIAILAPQKMSGGNVSDKALSFVIRFVDNFIRNNPQDKYLKNTDTARKFFGFSKKQLYPQVHRFLWSTAQSFDTIDSLLEHLQKKANNGQSDMGSPSRNSGAVSFKTVFVYDVSQTDPIPGQKAFEPMQKDVWQSKYNKEEDKATALVEASIEFAKSKNITVDLEKDLGETGGFSTGGSITINNTSQGQRLFGTVIHELAHELLHWDTVTRKNMTKQEKEIDAESTSYIVMKHFGYDADYAANYLALHGASSESVRKRKNSIAKAVKEIILGIRKIVLGDEKEASNKFNWFKRAKKAPVFNIDDLPIFNSEWDLL